MKKIVLSIILAALLAVACTACSSGGSSSSQASSVASSNAAAASSASVKKLEITDSAYVVSNGYVHYAVEITNPNDSRMANFADISIVGKTAEGKIRFSDSWTVGPITPNSVSYWANQAGRDVADGDSIEITVSVADRNWKDSKDATVEGLYKLENITVEPSTFGYLHATGEISVSKEGKIGSNSTTKPALTCILRDEAGKIVGGFSGYPQKELAVGTPSAFEISAYYKLPDYASAEVYAWPW